MGPRPSRWDVERVTSTHLPRPAHGSTSTFAEPLRAGRWWVALALVTGASACTGEGIELPGVSAGSEDAGSEDDDGSTGSAGSTGADGETEAELVRPNWHEDIAPLVAAHCQGCHDPDSLAFPLTTYPETLAWAPVIAMRTAEGEMPPWHAVETDECTPPHGWEHDARLSDAQKQLFADWAEAGAPEGDPALAAPIPAPMGLDLPDPSTSMIMGGSITVEREGDVLDQFHCLSFEPGNAQDVYVDAMQVIQGNAAILHHVLIFIDEDAESASWPQGIQEDCGSGPRVSNAQLIGAWVPGSRPIEAPEDVGILLPAGARIVFNVHYHASVGGPEVDDGTGLALRWTTDAPEWVSYFELVGAPGVGDSTTGEFSIPAGARDHEETIEFTLPPLGDAEVRLWSVGHHMHKIAVDAKTSVLRNGEELCMVQTPAWDYGWQRIYEFDSPVEDVFQLQPGDALRVRCTYDNTLENPALAAALAELGLDEPQDVVLGEGTLDEMCLAGVGVAVRQ
jgi:Copper type II ascorbate-dependent monooxygenase, C-terminal domain